MIDKQADCLWCKRTSQQVPLLQVEFKGERYWICPEHLPIMIHKSHLLADVLPGIEPSAGAGHDSGHSHEH